LRRIAASHQVNIERLLIIDSEKEDDDRLSELRRRACSASPDAIFLTPADGWLIPAK